MPTAMASEHGHALMARRKKVAAFQTVAFHAVAFHAVA
jgi:hypothetical protein